MLAGLLRNLQGGSTRLEITTQLQHEKRVYVTGDGLYVPRNEKLKRETPR